MSKNVIYFYLKFLIQNSLSKEVSNKIKYNIREIAFVHLNCIEQAIRVNESFAFLTLSVNNYFFINLKQSNITIEKEMF
jgi:hypothetical protein